MGRQPWRCPGAQAASMGHRYDARGCTHVCVGSPLRPHRVTSTTRAALRPPRARAAHTHVCPMCIYAPEGCQHGTHPNGTAHVCPRAAPWGHRNDVCSPGGSPARCTGLHARAPARSDLASCTFPAMHHASPQHKGVVVKVEAAMPARSNAVTFKRSEVGDFGGGSLGPPRRRLGAQWLGLTLGVPSCPELPGAS